SAIASSACRSAAATCSAERCLSPGDRHMTTRNVLITGASRGIGAAAARLAARDGWNVAINYATNRAAAEAVAADVRAAGRRAVIIAADVGDPAQIERMFAACDAELGPLG